MALAQTDTEHAVPEWTLGDRLRKARRYAGLSQQEMADALNVPVNRLGNWEAGYNQPRSVVDIVNRWAEVTHVDVSWLLGIKTRWFADSPVQEPLVHPGQGHFTLAAA